MIVDISLSLIDQACKQVNLWRSQGIWQDQQRIVFTLSLRELEHPSFILQVQEIMLKHGVAPRLFMFSLHTECLPKINSSLKLQVNRLHELGCGLLVDNVGYPESAAADTARTAGGNYPHLPSPDDRVHRN